MKEIIRELLDSHQIRKTKKQKDVFLQWLTPILEQEGYQVRMEGGSMKSRNIVIGDPEQAEVVFTAHYDTCAVMPFPNFITPKTPIFYWLYQFLIVIPIFCVIFFVSWLFSLLGEGMFLVGYWLTFAGAMGLMILGPANRHTVNDNTSGVAAVISLALSIPEELREKAAFVLFDLEEAGLIGSSSYAKKHRKEMEHRLLVNLDCVSDGETMLFVLKKGAWPHLEKLQAAYASDHRISAEFMKKGYVYPSDQANFKCGVGVCALNRTKRGLLYMDKIHTPKDTVFREENISWLVDGSIRLIKEMGQNYENA